MNTEKKIKLFGLAVIAAAVYHFADYVKDNEFHTYETDDTTFKNGEVLMPDYVHQDTLVVIDADFLNYCMEKYDIASDGDIADVLRTTTKKY